MAERCVLSSKEQYLFCQRALDDLKEARSYLRCIAKQKSRIVRSGLFTATVVAYMRPFAKSQIDSQRRYWLEPTDIGFSSSEAELHNAYRKIRSKTFAHTDLDAMKASVSVLPPRPGSSSVRVRIGSICVGRDPSRSDRKDLHENITKVIRYLDETLFELHDRLAEELHATLLPAN